MPLLFEAVNAGARKRTRVIADNATGLPLIVTEQDTAPILAANKRAANDWRRDDHRRTPGGWRHVAELPLVAVLQLMQQGVMRGLHVVDDKKFRAVLNDPDYRLFRRDNGARL
jgi:hypothetical protein